MAAFSGVEWYYDQLISEWMIAAIRAVCLAEMREVMNDESVVFFEAPASGVLGPLERPTGRGDRTLEDHLFFGQEVIVRTTDGELFRGVLQKCRAYEDALKIGWRVIFCENIADVDRPDVVGPRYHDFPRD